MHPKLNTVTPSGAEEQLLRRPRQQWELRRARFYWARHPETHLGIRRHERHFPGFSKGRAGCTT